FSTCGAGGAFGPSQAMCDGTYAGTSLAGLVSVTGGFQNFTLPYSGTYRITAVGAQGASGDPSYVGGRGALLRTDVALTQGSSFTIVVGQMGAGQSSSQSGGGGGASSIIGPIWSVAAGGGGTRTFVFQN